MATHNWQIFDESMSDTMTDIDYQSDSQRTNGVIPGVADPLLHNKLYRQCSVMAYAIAQTIVARGYSIDDSDPVSLTNAIQRTFAFSVNGDKPNASGAITTGKPLDAWPVGSIFITASNSNPSTLLGGGTWVKIEGKYLLASSSSYTAGSSYGAMTKNIAETNLPSHTHGFTTGSAGAHTHSTSGTAASSGAHTHTISADSAGAHTHTTSGTAANNGAHTHTISAASNGAHTHTTSGTAASAGAHTHTIETNEKGAHTHTASTGSAGNHAHTRGNMNITGTFFGDNIGGTYNTGAFSFTGSSVTPGIVDDVEAPSRVIDFDASETWTGTTNTTGAHTHSVTVDSGGKHTHGGTAASAGAHTHTTSGTAASNGAHTHTGSAASAGSHTHTTSGTAASAGAHTHTGSAASAGAHTHTTSGTAASAGAHTHTGTTNATGGGTAFNVMPLSVAVNVWQRTA